MFPNPAFRSASLVPKELSIFLFNYFFWVGRGLFSVAIYRSVGQVSTGVVGEMGEDQAQVGSLQWAWRVGRGRMEW